MRMEFGEAIDGCDQPRSIAPHCQILGAEILIGVPYAGTFPIGRGTQQPRAAVGEIDGGQPTLHEQAIDLRECWRVALEHERASRSADVQSVDGALQPLDSDRSVRLRL